MSDAIPRSAALREAADDSLDDAAPAKPPAISFDAMALSQPVRRALDELGFTQPTAVQHAAFEPAAAGLDLIVQSRTGTGKTLAFGLPLVDRLVREEDGLSALILAPTRELALQSQRVIEQISKYKHLRTVAIYGGAPMERQVQQLKQGVEIVSGTPGRVLDHIRRGTLDPSGISVLVLDEADEMFSMGFAKELNAIMDALPTNRQFLCFSATIDDHVQRMAERRMHQPQFITLSSDQVGAAEISHYFYMVLGDKLNALVRVLEVEDPESAIIFCNTKSETETVARHLCSFGFNADWLNGDLPQRDREQIMKATREGKLRYMVATDVAARGIDISHLTHVINFGFPESAEQYVHRTGRTGRAGRTGTAVSVIGPGNLGALYYLRLTFKIFPIERSLPSETELKTRRETDRLSLLLQAFQGSTLSEHHELVRRLKTHPQADRVLAGMVGSFFASLDGDVDESAAAARRERGVVARAPVNADNTETEEASELASTPNGQGPSKRRKRRRSRSRDEQLSADEADEAPALPARFEPEESENEARPAAPARFVADARPVPLGTLESGADLQPEDVPEARPELPDMTTLYLNVGKRDGLEGQDVSALLSSAAQLESDDIGRIRIKERHTFVGVPSERAEFVISALSGLTIKNRALHVERART
jgi:ATP-dependent RNA helicase DeaD